MEVDEAILARHSVRDFKPDPVPKDIILKILELAIHSPSSGNAQPWHIFVAGGAILEKVRQVYLERFQKEEGPGGKLEIAGTPFEHKTAAMQASTTQIRIERLQLQKIDPGDTVAAKASLERWARLFGTPILLVMCMPRSLALFDVFSIGLITQNILLAAQNFGLGSTVASVLVTHPDVLRKELEIPDDLIIVEGIALGYPSNHILNTYRSPRRSIGEVVTFKGI